MITIYFRLFVLDHFFFLTFSHPILKEKKEGRKRQRKKEREGKKKEREGRNKRTVSQNSYRFF